MNSSLNIDRQQQLRKVAILVATLDDALAERLLADLPSREAAAVQQIVEQLDDVDPAEYRAAVADFRQSIAEPSRRRVAPMRTEQDGVELDESLFARIAAEENSLSLPAVKPAASAQQSGEPWHALSDADAEALVEMLSAEQPQTIAVVLSRLETARAAELIGKLSASLQAEVLTRLADLDPADEQALEVVESQLAGWIEQQRQRQQRMAAGRDLVQRILQTTPESQRVALLIRLGKRNPALAESLSVQSHSKRPHAILPQAAPLHANRPVSDITYTTPYRPLASGSPSTLATLDKPTTESADPLTELEALDDQALLGALRLADRQTVMLALAGASERLMKRIVQGLPRRRANQFRQQVRAIGPARLSDMLAAQRELLRCGQRRSPPSSDKQHIPQ